MAWSEMTGTRKTTRQGRGPGPFTETVQITFVGTTAQTTPSNGDSYSTIVGSGNLPSTGLDAEPEVIQVGRVKKITSTKSQVTVLFGAYNVE